MHSYELIGNPGSVAGKSKRDEQIKIALQKRRYSNS